MDFFNVISLLGGLAMFLYGMRLMGDSLKENSSGTLKQAMSKVTNNPVKAFILGVLVTALIQSSTATIVITAGLVGAGILTLHQSLGIIIGANVGTTVTGQIIRLLDIDSSGSSFLRIFQPSTLAPIALIIGVLLIMTSFFRNARSIGNIAVGFGILFSGLLNMTGAVNSLSESGVFERLFAQLGDNPFLGYVTGAGVAFTLQSSSATVGILQAFSQTGALMFKSIYSVIVGIYLGDCVTTAIVCSIGAKAEARRVGIINILFNLSKTVLVLLVVTIVHKLGLLDGLWNKVVNSGDIANTNTIFNLGCAIALFPMLGPYEKLSKKIVRDKQVKDGKYKDVTDGLNPVFFNTPALALQSCYQTLLAGFSAARSNIEKSFGLLRRFEPAVMKQILKDEDEIDRMTDRLSKYMVSFLPHLRLESHISILNQYYKVASEFERLGDHAVNIATLAETMEKNKTSFSAAAISELIVAESILSQILDETHQTFMKRDVDAAARIEPLVQVSADLITELRKNHLKRMSTGECNAYADTTFSDLLTEYHRIGDVCSNVGIATLVRVKPELADHEHLYFEHLHSGGDETFDAAYRRVRKRYFSLLYPQEQSVPDRDAETEIPAEEPEAVLAPEEPEQTEAQEIKDPEAPEPTETEEPERK